MPTNESTNTTTTPLLTTLTPLPQCTFHNFQLGTLTITSQQHDISKPDLSTLQLSHEIETSRLEDAAEMDVAPNTPPIEAFLKRSEVVFSEIIMAMSRQESVEKGLLDVQFYDALFSELSILESLNNATISSLSDDLRNLILIYRDDKKRNHELMVELCHSFPHKCPIFTTDLPSELEIVWKWPSVGLVSVFDKFRQIIQSYQPLWKELDEIDQNAWVLEPPLPARRSCLERRIALQAGLSIVFSLDPQKPRSIPPNMRFIGASSDIDSYRTSYNDYITTSNEKTWDDSFSVLQNLKTCFPNLPSPQTSHQEEYVTECGICYTHRLPSSSSGKDKLPDAACQNSCCSKTYHEECLFEWLHSLPSVRMSFDRVFGTCPYCCEPISVKVKSRMF